MINYKKVPAISSHNNYVPYKIHNETLHKEVMKEMQRIERVAKIKSQLMETMQTIE